MPNLSFDCHSQDRPEIININWIFEAIVSEKLGVGKSTRSIA